MSSDFSAGLDFLRAAAAAASSALVGAG